MATVDMSSVDEANNWDDNGHGGEDGPVFDPAGGKDQPGLPAWALALIAMGALGFAGVGLQHARGRQQ
jgi:hypothetical protein